MAVKLAESEMCFGVPAESLMPPVRQPFCGQFELRLQRPHFHESLIACCAEVDSEEYRFYARSNSVVDEAPVLCLMRGRNIGYFSIRCQRESRAFRLAISVAILISKVGNMYAAQLGVDMRQVVRVGKRGCIAVIQNSAGGGGQ